MYSPFFCWGEGGEGAAAAAANAACMTDKVQIVRQGSYHKFTISDDAENLRRMLMATGQRELVEASPVDRIWGVGFVEKEAERMRHRWGQNLLGKALVEVRERLRGEEKAKKI